MRLTVQELLAAMRPPQKLRRYDTGTLRLHRRPHSPLPAQGEIERIRAASGLAPASETPNERAWRRYFELTDPLIRHLAHINHAIGPSADAATAKAKLLRPTQPEQEDPNIAAALAAAAGRSPAPQSLSDRLAALKARGGD
jgi:hypothetical protein